MLQLAHGLLVRGRAPIASSQARQSLQGERGGRRRRHGHGHGQGERGVVQLDGVVAVVGAAVAALHLVGVVVLHVGAQAHLVLGHLEAEAAAEGAAVLAVEVGEVALEVVPAREPLLADGAHQALSRVHHHAQRVAEEHCNKTRAG